MRKTILIIVIAAVVVLLAAGSLVLVISASSNTTSPAASDPIGEDEAYRIALAHANVTETAVTQKRAVFDRETGRDEWDVEFWVGSVEYDCEIDAVTGEVLHFESDAPVQPTGSTAPTGTTSGENTPSGTTVTEAEAKTTVLTHAGVAEADVTNYRCEIDYDDGRKEYEIEFCVGTTEYDYTVDAETGKILSHETEEHTDPSCGIVDGTTPPDTSVTEAEAKAVVLRHSGVAEADISNYRCKIDTDDGRKEYKIEFYVGTTEYDYTIDASNGAILSYERDEHKTSSSTTSPSDTSVTEAEAKATVLAHSGVAEADISNYRCKIDTDDGRTEYKIEFYVGTTEYDYTVDASNGAILSYERDEHKTSSSTTSGTTSGGNTPSDTSVTEAEAKATVLKHAGVAEADITNYRCKTDYDDGRKEYEIEFYVGTTEYEYTVDASTGRILSYETEDHHSSHHSSSDGSTGTATVSEAQAKATVLTHAGVKEADITNYRCKADYDDGRKEYEIEFYVGTTEYDYTVDAGTGKILSYETEDHRSSHHSTSGGSTGTATVSEAQAKQIALEKAKLSESEITGYRSKLERDDGRLEYEIEFRANGLEYEFTIDAETGKILDFDIDNDD